MQVGDKLFLRRKTPDGSARVRTATLQQLTSNRAVIELTEPFVNRIRFNVVLPLNTVKLGRFQWEISTKPARSRRASAAVFPKQNSLERTAALLTSLQQVPYLQYSMELELEAVIKKYTNKLTKISK